LVVGQHPRTGGRVCLSSGRSEVPGVLGVGLQAFGFGVFDDPFRVSGFESRVSG
jgi:hypothetical protein